MDTILPYPATAHDYEIIRMCLFQMRRLAVHRGWHYAEGSYKHKTFSHIGVIKEDLSECGGNTTLVSTILHPLNNPIQKPPGMKVGF